MKRKIEICDWEPNRNPEVAKCSCDDLCTYKRVARKKNDLLESVQKHQKWDLL